MKKIFSLLLTVATTLTIATSCADVPMPYDIFANQDNSSFGKKMPYKSATMNTDWTTYALNGKENPWSQGSSYTQATGYQKWDGADTKSNKDVEGYLISPAINTTCESGKVKITFEHCIAYSNKDAQFRNHIGLYVSDNFDGKDASAATWTKIEFPINDDACNSSWELKSVGDIQLPEQFVCRDSIYFAFYMKSVSAEQSITWEPMNFYVQEGVAQADTTATDTTTTKPSSLGTKEAPLTVAEAKNVSSGNGYVTGYIVGYINGKSLTDDAKFEAASADGTNILIADDADCKDASLAMPIALPTGDIRTKLNPAIATNIGKKVILYGSFEKYFGTAGLKSTSWAKIDGTEVGTDPDKPVVPVGETKGDGTKDNPFNIAGVLAEAGKLASGATGTTDVYFKGIVSSIKEISSTYGNATFYLSDDGTSDNTFYVYRALGLNNAAVTDENFIKVGDEVVVCGKLMNYNGTLETSQKNAYVVSVNGKSEGGTADNTGTTDNTGTSEGLSIDGNTVTLTNSAVTAGTSTVTLDLSTLGLTSGAVVSDPIRFSDGTTLTCGSGTNTKNSPVFNTATKGLRVYANNTLTFEGIKEIAKIEMTCDVYNNVNQVGNTTATVTFEGKKAVYTNASPDKTQQLRPQTITITYAK